MEWANIAAFGASLVLGARLLTAVLLPPGVVIECGEFFRADALSVVDGAAHRHGFARNLPLRRALFQA